MKKMLLNVVAAILVVMGLGGVAAMSPAAYAADDVLPSSTNPATEYIGGGDKTIVPEGVSGGGLMGTIQSVVNVIIGVIGMLAVFMIIMGGINFATSQGDAAKVTKARNTILYGVVGLVVSLLAFAIVNFVLSSIFK